MLASKPGTGVLGTGLLSAKEPPSWNWKSRRLVATVVALRFVMIDPKLSLSLVRISAVRATMLWSAP
jgi:hypothetical protein